METKLMETNKKEKRLLAVIIIIITFIIVIILNAPQQDILLGHITRLGLHMTLAILHVREHGVEISTKLILRLLMQPVLFCLPGVPIRSAQSWSDLIRTTRNPLGTNQICSESAQN